MKQQISIVKTDFCDFYAIPIEYEQTNSTAFMENVKKHREKVGNDKPYIAFWGKDLQLEVKHFDFTSLALSAKPHTQESTA